jgi:hypothetical protein
MTPAGECFNKRGRTIIKRPSRRILASRWLIYLALNVEAANAYLPQQGATSQYS